jgi:uncharacterized protein YkwD
MSRSRLRRFAAVLALASASPMLVGGVGPRQNFEERLLAAQNRERDAIGVAPLVWDPVLARSAREWARYLARTGKAALSSAGTTRISSSAGIREPGMFSASDRSDADR